MPIIFDLENVTTAQVHVRASAIAELMAMLHQTAEPGHHLNRVREHELVLSALKPKQRRDLRAFAPLWARYRVRALLPHTLHSSDSLAAGIAELREMPLSTFVMFAAEAIVGRRMPASHDIVTNEESAAAFIALCRERGADREELGLRLVGRSAETRTALADFLESCGTQFFSSYWQSIKPRLDAAEREIAVVLAQNSFAIALTTLTPGSYYLPEHGQVAFDKLQKAFVEGDGRTFRLVPSLFTHPHVLVKFDSYFPATPAEYPIVIQFPITEMGAVRATTAEVQFRMSVLAEPNRLDICRNLVNEECTTSELAHRTKMTAPQVSRHLARLREAGLLDSHREGRFVRHRLRLKVIYSLGHDLLGLVVR